MSLFRSIMQWAIDTDPDLLSKLRESVEYRESVECREIVECRELYDGRM